jgi:hypothetical protein
VKKLRVHLDSAIAHLQAQPTAAARANWLWAHHQLKNAVQPGKLQSKFIKSQASLDKVAAGGLVVAGGHYDIFSCFSPYEAPATLEQWDGTVWFNVMEQFLFLHQGPGAPLPWINVNNLVAVPAAFAGDEYMVGKKTLPQQLRGPPRTSTS